MRRRMPMRTIEEEIEILHNRLVSSTYNDDKIQALEDLYPYSLSNPAIVGTQCIKSIYESMAKMDFIDIQLRLLRHIINGSYKEEFTEIIFSEENSIDILIDLDLDKVLEFFNIFSTEFFYKKLAIHPKCTEFLGVLIEKNLPEILLQVINKNSEIKERLVFEGVLEKIIVKLENNSTAQRSGFETLFYLLINNSILNQNYFIKSELFKYSLFYTMPYKKQIYDILSLIINPKNSRFREFQKTLFIPKFIHKAVENKHYLFLSLISLDNIAGMKLLLDRYININNLIDDVELEINLQVNKKTSTVNNNQFVDNFNDLHFSNSAFSFLTQCKSILSKEITSNFKLKHCYKINLLFGINIPDEIILKDIENNKISTELLVYLLFEDNYVDIKLIDISTLEGIEHNLCLMLYLANNIELDMNVYTVIDELKNFRKLLCSNIIINEYFTETLIINVCDLIKEQNLQIEKNALEETAEENILDQTNSLKLETAYDNNSTSSLQDSFKAIKETSLKKIGSAFGFFKTSDKKQEDTYDL